MKSIRSASVVLGIFCAIPAFAADKHDAQRAELEAIKAELKPLRERAYLEADVIAARKTLDAAYRAYWDSVRAAMVRLDPEKKKLIEKEIKLHKEQGAVPGGSRAEDYEKKAAAEKASGSEKKSNKSSG
ncbi:MAG: hypothetical protein PHC88_11210 [Terrimicrobiaceae bacterium]|nr:hypothetical protein [Terrimicrobiaceae bacterium]